MKVSGIKERLELLRRLPKEELSRIRETTMQPVDENRFWVYLRGGQFEQVRALLADHFILMLSVDNDGNTPLHIAVKERNVGLVKLLLVCGADPDKANLYGTTPHGHAKKHELKDILALLQ